MHRAMNVDTPCTGSGNDEQNDNEKDYDKSHQDQDKTCRSLMKASKVAI